MEEWAGAKQNEFQQRSCSNCAEEHAHADLERYGPYVFLDADVSLFLL